jgi:DNA segregation ATPase FtsK/SpoIIIE, S-DNA-T family
LNKVDKKQLKEKELPFVLGIQQSTGKLIIEDLTKLLNMLIAGTPGSGKSCFVNVVIQSMMLFGNNVLFLLADFKGNELNQYKDFQNCIFITKHEQLSQILDELIQEMESRYRKLGKLKNIRDYNKLHNDNDKLPYVILLVDEMACISLCDRELSEEINMKIMDLLNRGRASGIIFIGAMQRPSSKQINTNVRANLDTKVVCRVSDKKETQFTDTPRAEKLESGEFLVNAQEYNCEKFKGLFIDDQNRNIVFENLENKLSGGGKVDGINIKDKKYI